MFPKTGNKLHPRRLDSRTYARAIADALRTELGQSHRATKTLMKWTGASERTVKNWLSGAYGPSGDNLVQLVRESDCVLATILGLAAREHHMVGANLIAIRASLGAAVQLVDELLAPPDYRLR